MGRLAESSFIDLQRTQKSDETGSLEVAGSAPAGMMDLG